MKLVEEQPEDLHIYQERYRDNFETSCGPVARNMFLYHLLQSLTYTKGQYDQQVEKGKKLSIQNLKEIRFQDSSEHIFRIATKSYNQIVADKNQGETIDKYDMFKLMLLTFKPEIRILACLFIISSVLRVAVSYSILLLFESIDQANYKSAYTFTALILVLLYLQELICSIGLTATYQLGNHIKAALAMLLYAKISKMTLYTIKNIQIGRVVNMLSNDLSSIQIRLGCLTNAISVPILVIGMTAILYSRIGWIVFVGLFILVLQVIISSFISKWNGQTMKEINKYKDQRVQKTTEMIQWIKSIKMYGWELPFKKMIQKSRQRQVQALKKLALGRSIDRALAGIVGFVSTISIYILSYKITGSISSVIIFSTLEMMASLKQSIISWILGVGLYYELKVIFGRFAQNFNTQNKNMIKINQSMKQPLNSNNIIKDNDQTSNIILNFEHGEGQQSGDIVSAEQALLRQAFVEFSSFKGYWKEDFTTPSLKDINYLFKKGILYGITGTVGAGKSGLLGAILKQIPFYSGKLTVSGSVAFVEQEPIMFTDTVKNNILFGKQFDNNLYEKTVMISCLKSDFDILAQKDQTVVGQKGVTLSGGQKARISLARALYSDADIYLFDDPLSAVDAKVAKLLFELCLVPLSKHKTVILVTHQIRYIKECDQVLIMDNGSIVASGHPRKLEHELQKISSSAESSQETQTSSSARVQLDMSEIQSQRPQRSSRENTQSSPKKPLQPQRQQQHSDESVAQVFTDDNTQVSLSTYCKFFFISKVNYFLIPITVLLFILSEAIIAVYYRFLADIDNIEAGQSLTFTSEAIYWITLASILAILLVVLIIKFYMANLTVITNNSALHDKMIESVLFCPSSFFDRTPSGILVNKFSTDIGLIDNNFIFSLWDTLEGPSMVIVALVNLCQINLYLIIPSVAFITVSILFLVYSRNVILECKRLDLEKKSRILHCLSQTAAGLLQLKVYKQSKQFLKRFSQYLNEALKASLAFDMITRGFTYYETQIAEIMMAIGVVVGVTQINYENRALYGVTVVYLLTITGNFYRYLKQAILLEGAMVSAERMLQVLTLERQKQLRSDYDNQVGLQKQVKEAKIGEEMHQEWPQTPSLQFSNFSARYSENAPLSLKNLNFVIKAEEKVGIVGRTGAGKSSIIGALFHMFEPQQGSQYRIGQHDALQMGLHSLRKHISVIPQVPFLFKGTVRQNIDPFESSTDEQLWNVLRQVGLSSHIQSFKNGLSTYIDCISSAFSVGQRQLICLARALLNDNKYLVLDEATSNVDMETDAFIQKIIRSKFIHTTVITVAHRLLTIADYDRVIVMERGEIKEMGSPWELIVNKGHFYDMVKHTGKDAEKIIRKAYKSLRENVKFEKQQENDQILIKRVQEADQ